MTYKIKKIIYLCIPIIVAILYSVKENIFCVNVYELSMSINIVQCSLHKRVKGLVSRVHKAPPLSPKLSVTQLTQPTTYSCHTIGSTPTGFCHMVLISFNNPPPKKSNLKK